MFYLRPTPCRPNKRVIFTNFLNASDPTIETVHDTMNFFLILAQGGLQAAPIISDGRPCADNLKSYTIRQKDRLRQARRFPINFLAFFMLITIENLYNYKIGSFLRGFLICTITSVG